MGTQLGDLIRAAAILGLDKEGIDKASEMLNGGEPDEGRAEIASSLVNSEEDGGESK